MPLKYRVQYGFDPQTNDSASQYWRGFENYDDPNDAGRAFDYFKSVCPYDEETQTRANKLWLYLMDDDMIVATIQTHYYVGNEPVWGGNTVEEDRVHIEVDPQQSKVVYAIRSPRIAPQPLGSWVVSVYDLETGRSHIVGLTRTPEGVIGLITQEIQNMGFTRRLTVEYHRFLDEN